MGAERVELVRVGGRDKRLLEFSRDGHRAPIRIEEAAPEMAELDRVETMDFSTSLPPIEPPSR